MSEDDAGDDDVEDEEKTEQIEIERDYQLHLFSIDQYGSSCDLPCDSI